MSLKINIKRPDKGRGSWKLNTSILTEEKYLKIINDLIDKYSTEIEIKDINITWDNFKIAVRDSTIEYCKTKSIKQKSELTKLENQLAKLIEQRDTTLNVNEETNTKLNDIEVKIENIYNSKIKGAQIRSRAEWVEKGEKKHILFPRP